MAYKAQPKMKLWKQCILGAISLILLAPIAAIVVYLVVFVYNARKHIEHVEMVSETFSHYSEGDWRRFYATCMAFFDQHKAQETSFSWPYDLEIVPEPISDVAPRSIWLRDGGMTMRWTGGHDEYTLYLWVVIVPGKEVVFFDQTDERGLFLLDSSKEPYVTNVYTPNGDD